MISDKGMNRTGKKVFAVIIIIAVLVMILSSACDKSDNTETDPINNTKDSIKHEKTTLSKVAEANKTVEKIKDYITL